MPPGGRLLSVPQRLFRLLRLLCKVASCLLVGIYSRLGLGLLGLRVNVRIDVCKYV